MPLKQLDGYYTVNQLTNHHAYVGYDKAVRIARTFLVLPTHALVLYKDLQKALTQIKQP